jgi:hypothetical protein
MSQSPTTTRLRNALASGAAAYLTLLAMSMWITGPSEFLFISFGFTLHFLAISFCASLIEACFLPTRTKRTIIIGICTGLTGGFAIVLQVFSNI